MKKDCCECVGKHLCHDVKHIRMAAGLSRVEFVDLLGIPYRTVQSWELGERECPSYVLDLIRYRLGMEE